MCDHVWLFWVNDSIEGVYAEEADALKAMTRFMGAQSRQDRDIAWRPMSIHRWSAGRFARVEILRREVS